MDDAKESWLRCGKIVTVSNGGKLNYVQKFVVKHAGRYYCERDDGNLNQLVGWKECWPRNRGRNYYGTTKKSEGDMDDEASRINPHREVDKINELLADREPIYGDYVGQAMLSQQLKGAMHCHDNWFGLKPEHQESLEMIQHKIARIINGDSNYKDSWTDIIGYARLIEKDL